MDHVANALARIKNAVKVEKDVVELRKTNIVSAVVEIMEREGFIAGYEEDGDVIRVTLLYDNGVSAITDLKRVSKGGQRVYVGAGELKLVFGGRGIGIISTSQGIMTVTEAREKNVGGEYICKMW